MPSAQLDHVVVIAPSLAEGLAHVAACLGVDVPLGGVHPRMGTHNCLARIGPGISLEIIAVDPSAPPPSQPRWFDMDDAVALRRAWDGGFRLRSWVARTTDLASLETSNSGRLGRSIRQSRGDREWDFLVRPDGRLPEGGALPCLIDWGPRGTPADTMPDIGLRLIELVLEHPAPDHVREWYDRLGVAGGPVVKHGPALRYRATFQTPSGVRELT